MTGFYVVEATLHQGFSDPVGPAAQGWLAAPGLALSQYEVSPASNTTLRASDVGYRTRATDSIGVQAYPPTVVQAFSVDVAANLDPTASNLAVAWGTLTLANADHAYDTLIANYAIDGRPITIYRGDKTIDSRSIPVDPSYASLVQVFSGVMGPWQPGVETVDIALHDATYFLTKQFPRTFYGGTGLADGGSNLIGVSKPIVFGGVSAAPLTNITPQAVDPANLIYQFSDYGGTLLNAYDGGVPLTNDGIVPSVYSGAGVSPGHVCYDPTTGLLQLGSTPVFGLTCDVYHTESSGGTTGVGAQVMSLLVNRLKLPTALIGGYPSTAMDVYGVDATAVSQANTLNSGLYLASNDTSDGLTAIDRLLVASGMLLVPGRDGKLRLLVLSAVPIGSTPVLALDYTTIVSLNRIALPASVDPPPWRMRLAYGRNFTVQTGNQTAGGILAAREALVSTAARVVTAVGTATPTTSYSTANDPPIIGLDGGSLELTTTNPQVVVNAMIALWGVQRKLYEIVVSQTIGYSLDWASIVRVTAPFDGLNAGVLGQIVGWRYSSSDATATFRVLI